MKRCNYCNDKRNLWIKKFQYWNLRPCYNQHTLGSLAIVLKSHKELFSELNENEIIELLKIIKISQNTLIKQFNPDWFNVQQNGNWENHLHVLVILRYKTKKMFNKKFFTDKNFGNPVKYKTQQESSTFLRKLAKTLQKQLSLTTRKLKQ